MQQTGESGPGVGNFAGCFRLTPCARNLLRAPVTRDLTVSSDASARMKCQGRTDMKIFEPNKDD